MFSFASKTGSATDLRTLICAAWWQRTSGRKVRIASTAVSDPASPKTNRAPSGTFSFFPEERLSSTRTS